MKRPIPLATRMKIRAYRREHTTAMTAAKFRVSKSTVDKFMAQPLTPTAAVGLYFNGQSTLRAGER